MQVLLVGVALAAAFAPLPHGAVERLYSQGPYAAAQPWVTGASNLVTVALFDLLAAGVALAWLALAVRDLVRRRSWVGSLAGIAARTVVWAAFLYLAFLAAWGLNYRRVPLTQKLAYDQSRISPEAARDLGLLAVQQANALFDAAHAELAAARVGPHEVDPVLAAAFVSAQADLGWARPAEPARPKTTVIDLYFQRAGVSGMTDPFFLETLVSSDLLPFERPAVIAHEWSHLAGINDEGEANFAGWLTCLRGSPAHQYSGWLFLVGEFANAVRETDRGAMYAGLAPGPREDLRAVARRIQQHVSPRVSAAGWRAYNQYLKANRIERGTASYADVVKLVLGVPFDPGWVPKKR